MQIKAWLVKRVAPRLWVQQKSEDKMSLRFAAVKVVQYSRQCLSKVYSEPKQRFYKRGFDILNRSRYSNRPTILQNSTPSFTGRNGLSSLAARVRATIVDGLLSRVSSTTAVASELRRRTASGRLLSLVGIVFSSGGAITREDEMESVCYEIRVS